MKRLKTQKKGKSGDIVCAKGVLAQGIECPLLTDKSGEKVYSLMGDLRGFKMGDEVCVAGPIADISFCMEGFPTLVVSWIGKECKCG